MEKKKPLVLRRSHPLTDYIEEPVFYLNAVFPHKVKNGGKTVEGTVYVATNVATLDQIEVVILGYNPYVTQDALNMLSAGGAAMFVEFLDATVMPYFSYHTKSIQDSVRATGLRLVTIV